MKKILTSIWFLSALIAAPIIFFMPSLFEKYRVKEISREAVSYQMTEARVFYHDLYGDNVKRSVIAGKDEILDEERMVVEFFIDKPLFVFTGNPGRIYPELSLAIPITIRKKRFWDLHIRQIVYF